MYREVYSTNFADVEDSDWRGDYEDAVRHDSKQRPLSRIGIELALAEFEPVKLEVDGSEVDRFCERKGVTRGSLSAMGTQVKGDILAFPYAAGVKFRDMTNGKRWSRGRFQNHPLAIHLGLGGEPYYANVIVAEGETDAAALLAEYREADVAVMPLGALTWTPLWTAQLGVYRVVNVATDNDVPGEGAFERLRETGLPVARHAAPDGHKDWSAWAVARSQDHE
jgi:hypothetical protein